MCAVEIREYERRLRRAGLPLLIEDYSAREDVFTRAIPFLGFWFLATCLNGANFDWPTAANLAVIAGGLVLLLAPIVLLNLRRGRPWYAPPQRVGNGELAIFLLVPPILPLIGGGQVGVALVTVVANLLVLGVVYVVVGFGLLSILRWSLARLVGQLRDSFAMLAKAIPLLLFFAIVLFVNAEMWQVFGDISDGNLAGVVALFVVLGAIFLAVRLPGEVRELERREGVDPPLTRRQRFNVGLVMFVSYALQTLVVAVAIALFFVAFGLLTTTGDVIDRWTGDPGDEIGSITVFGTTVRITAELLRVSTAMAAFSGLYYAISVLTDATYRREFLGEFERSMQRTFALRAAYLAAVARG
ncbi:MAG: hypothetical protein IRZ32_09330 [Solirubrobacteraceae bacterium]|nr:hypothetical protein [Solirubrobacteraceae bacterium]